MGFVVANPCLSQPPLYHSLLPSSSSTSQSVALCLRNGIAKKKNRPVMASLRQEEPNDGVSLKRRAILFVGISVLPLLQLRAIALEGLASNESEQLAAREDSQRAEEAFQNNSPQNPFLSLLNGLGVFSSGVLGALYALGLQEKKATEATIESMKTKLKEKEAAFVTLEKSFEAKLLNEQEQHTKLISKEKEEQQSLMNQLSSAKSTVEVLGKELKSEKRVIAELKVEIDSLQSNLAKAGEDKRTLEEKLKENIDSIESLEGRINLLSLELKEKEDTVHNLSSSLLEKETELKNVNSIYEQTKNELAAAYAEIEGLKDELLRSKMELESKNSLVDELNSRVGSLIVERDDSKRSFDAIQEQYNDLKLSSDSKAALDAKLLSERELEVGQLKGKLDTAMNEARKNQLIISDLTKQREDLKKMLDLETVSVNNLKHELHITQETLGKSRNEASDLAELLTKSRNQCAELETEVSRVLAEFAEARKTLEVSIEEAKLSGEVLGRELLAATELVKKTKDALETMSLEHAALAENQDNLQKELVDVYKKAEAAAQDLREEKKLVSSLKRELQAMEKQVLKDKETRLSLETDLEEATKSLDEMNRNAMILSKDLEMTNARCSILEGEKEILYKTLTEQKNLSKEAQQNMEDAHNLVMKLGKERETLEKRSKKLEEELASAKGEILRLRSKINVSKPVVNNQPIQSPEKDEAESTVTVTAAKRGRRRKTASSE